MRKKFSFLAGVGAALLIAFIFGPTAIHGLSNQKGNVIQSPVAHAQELYQEFVCPCCGAVLDPKNICCGSMEQRIAYIDDLVEQGLSKEEILLKTVKEFGVNALARQEVKEEIKSALLRDAPVNAPKIVFNQESFDLGTIRQRDGITFTLVPFENTGENDLVIHKLDTSCGCTSASIVYKGMEGPTFTMPGHGKKNPTNWNVSIAPGQSAMLKIYYDPNAHGPQKKPNEFITRTVSVYSNDPVEFEKQIRIELEQTP